MDKLTKRIEAALQRMKTNHVVLARVQSKSNKKVKHEICLAADHSIYCKCEGWKFNKDKPKTCRHIRRFKEKVVPQEM